MRHCLSQLRKILLRTPGPTRASLLATSARSHQLHIVQFAIGVGVWCETCFTLCRVPASKCSVAVRRQVHPAPTRELQKSAGINAVEACPYRRAFPKSFPANAAFPAASKWDRAFQKRAPSAGLEHTRGASSSADKAALPAVPAFAARCESCGPFLKST